MVQLKPMTEAEYLAFERESLIEYAAEKKKAEGLTDAEAEKIARDSFNRLLPQGPKTPDHHVFTVLLTETGEAVGCAWFAVMKAPALPEGKKAFIYDIKIKDAHQGKGLGRGTMLAIEAEVRKQGMSRVGLHVFGHNHRARKLYESLGYLPTNLVMEKAL